MHLRQREVEAAPLSLSAASQAASCFRPRQVAGSYVPARSCALTENSGIALQ
jgi:hypothetical protein